jgi:hypothetical protein
MQAVFVDLCVYIVNFGRNKNPNPKHGFQVQYSSLKSLYKQ